MMWLALVLLGVAPSGEPVPPSPPDEACAVTMADQPLAAMGSHGEILQTVFMSTWAMSTDGGKHWRADNQRCLSYGALYFWRLPPRAGRLCMAVPAYEVDHPVIDHRCTHDEGRTWFSWLKKDASEGHLLDVTANPQEPDDMIAVQTYQDGIPQFATLVRSRDAGRTWEDQWAAGSLQIVGLLGDRSTLTLKGPTFETYTELWSVPFRARREREIEGPWKMYPSAQLTQAAVNPSNANQIAVSAWVPGEHREITFVSHNGGRAFDVLQVPSNAIWPLEFADTEGRLLVNLRGTSPRGEFAYASLYSPATQTWQSLQLPKYTGRAMARGGAIFATGGSFYQLQKITQDGPSWTEMRIP